MASTTKSAPQNAFQRLLAARIEFLGATPKKTGKNISLSFKYFELDDIVPVALPIFAKVGLIPVVNFTNEVATMTLVNVDDPNDRIDFTSPMREPEVNRGTNPVMALGSAHTYLRRYLYMIALDICEPDTINAQAGTTTSDDGDDTPAPAAPPVRKPLVTAGERKDIANNLANADGNASELQIKQLKNVLIKLRETDPANEALVQKIAEQTVGFTQISKSDCEKLITGLSERLSGGKQEG